MYAVVYKDGHRVHSVYKERAEASYCITDCFAYEHNKVYIIDYSLYLEQQQARNLSVWAGIFLLALSFVPIFFILYSVF